MSVPTPRLLEDLTGWFDLEFPFRSGHAIRVEENVTDSEYTVRAELPGLDPEKEIQLRVVEGYLVLHAERIAAEHTKGHSEFRYGAMQRTVRLPAGADPVKTTARYEKGILTVTVPLHAPTGAGMQIAIQH